MHHIIYERHVEGIEISLRCVGTTIGLAEHRHSWVSNNALNLSQSQHAVERFLRGETQHLTAKLLVEGLGDLPLLDGLEVVQRTETNVCQAVRAQD